MYADVGHLISATEFLHLLIKAFIDRLKNGDA